MLLGALTACNFEVHLSIAVPCTMTFHLIGAGYHWITFDDRSGGEICPIIVANHTTAVDSFYMIFAFGCSAVANHNVKALPFFGQVCRGLQGIFVNRKDPNGRQACKEEIRVRNFRSFVLQCTESTDAEHEYFVFTVDSTEQIVGDTHRC